MAERCGACGRFTSGHPMTDKPRLADARRLADAASKSPWTYGVVGFQEPEAHELRDGNNMTITTLGYDEASYHDVEFMTASRTLVPAMEQALRDVLALAAKWEQGATRWADPLPVPPEVEQVRAAIAAHLDIEGGSERA